MLGRLSGKAVATDPFPQLTPRERQVLELLAAGLSTTVIGAKLGLASKTINNHASAVFAKLQVADRTEAVLRAREAGWAAARAALPSEPKRWLSNASRAFSRSPILSASRAGSHGHHSLSAIMLGRWAGGRTPLAVSSRRRDAALRRRRRCRRANEAGRTGWPCVPTQAADAPPGRWRGPPDHLGVAP